MVLYDKYVDSGDIHDVDRYSDFVRALDESDIPMAHTPFGATKTAELDIQFSMDPSYGLSKSRYGWYSNDVLFDGTHFDDTGGTISIETSATAGDTARLRSAYPGKYTSHTLAEPGIGASIPEEHLEYDENGHVSLTHGEISIESVEWQESTDSGVNALGWSFETDGVYMQVRKNDSDEHFIHQSDWNIDSLDGNGPSGATLRPEEGYIYQWPHTWYGQGAMYIGIIDARKDEILPAHRVVPDGEPSINTPNMPIQVTVENKTTADPLHVDVAGMQYATHGGVALNDSDTGRTTEVTRTTTASPIDTVVVEENGSVDPFAEPGYPLIAAERDFENLESRVSLSVNLIDAFVNLDSSAYVFIFDEYDNTALANANFQPPVSRNGSAESRMLFDTSATDYTPSENATLRGLLYVGTGNKSTEFTEGDASSKLPLEGILVMTAALAPGSNAANAAPAIMEVRESW